MCVAWKNDKVAPLLGNADPGLLSAIHSFIHLSYLNNHFVSNTPLSAGDILM